MFNDKRCTNHPAKRALSFCHCCKEFYCEACLTEAADYYFCTLPDCETAASSAVAAAHEASRASYAQLFCPQCIDTTEAKPGAMRLLLMNGIGFRLGRSTNECPICHSVEARVWFCLFFLPIFPVTRYRLVFIGRDSFITRRPKLTRATNDPRTIA